MTISRKFGEGMRGSNLPLHWEMVSSFVLSLVESKPHQTGQCVLEPVAAALESFQLDESFLCEVSAAVEQAGMVMRDNCPEGKLTSVNVRVNVDSQVMHSSRRSSKPWLFYVIKQIASSESDNLNAFDEPFCYIDLHIYQEM
jgi:hypothetical protein